LGAFVAERLVQTHTDPNSNSLTTVTRTDVGQGSLHSNGTLNSGSATGRDGTASGNTTNDATVTISHQMNGKVGDHTYRFADARGTLIGGQKLGFSAAWDADPEEIHASLVKKASEHTTGTEGERTFYVDVNGVHYSGNTTRQTIDSPDAETLTDTVTDSFWQYDVAGFNDIYRRDRTETSTLTAKSGKTEAGDASRTESIVRTWKETIDDRHFTHIDNEPSGGTDTTDVTTSHTVDDHGTQTKTTTLSGPVNRPTATLKITLDANRTDVNVTTTVRKVDREDSEVTQHETYTKTERTGVEYKRSSDYESQHKVGPNDRAQGGSFTSTDKTTTTDFTRKDWNDHGGGSSASTTWTISNKGWSENSNSIVNDLSENGSYYDRPLSGGRAERIQDGSYRIEVTRTNLDQDKWEKVPTWDPGLIDQEWEDHKYEDKTVQLITGTYSPGGGTEDVKPAVQTVDHVRHYKHRTGYSDVPAHVYYVDYDLHIAPNAEGQQEGYILEHSWNEFEDGQHYPTREWFDRLMEGDPFGFVHYYVTINDVSDDWEQEYGSPVDPIHYRGPRKTGPAPPGSIGAAFIAGLGYGAIEVGNAGLKIVSLGYANYDADADAYGKSIGLSENDRKATRFFANVGTKTGAAAGVLIAAPAVLGAAGETAVGQAVGRMLVTPGGQIATRLGSAYFTGTTGAAAINNGMAAAQEYGQGNYWAAAEHFTDASLDSVGFAQGLKGVFAKPRCIDPEVACFVAGTQVLQHGSSELAAAPIIASIDNALVNGPLYRLLCVTAIVMAGNEFGKMQRAKKDKRRKKVADMKREITDDASEQFLDDELWGDYGIEDQSLAIVPRRVSRSACRAAVAEEPIPVPAIATCVDGAKNPHASRPKSRAFPHPALQAKSRQRLRALRMASLTAWLGIAALLAGFGWINHRGERGPLPTMTSASYEPQSSTAIETIHVGDRVMGNLSPGEMAGDTEVEQSTWRKLRLSAEAVWPDGTIDDIHVETLQPPEWVAHYKAEVGADVPIPLDLVEMGLPTDLTARVVANEACPTLKAGPGRVVLTTVNHLNSDLYELTVAASDGHIETIRPTGLHRFYRPLDQSWCVTKDLRSGDELQGPNGPLFVRSVQSISGTRRVYNMTVEGEHVYRVSLLGALVHNTCAWEVGPANELKARSIGDKLDVHHAVQAHPAEQIIPGYNRATGPAITVPENLHGQIPKVTGVYQDTARNLLGRDIRALRRVGAPRDALRELIKLNKESYPGVFD